MNDATRASQAAPAVGGDPLEETQQNPELPRLLAMRAAQGLAHLTLDSASPTESGSARSAAQATLVFAAVVLTLALALTVHLVGQAHGAS